jgi:hypothetical protein
MTPLSVGARLKKPPRLCLSLLHGGSGSGIGTVFPPTAAMPQGVPMPPVDQVLTFAFIAYTVVRFAVGFGPG